MCTIRAMTPLEQAEVALKKWQPILRLSDWDVKIRVKRSKDFHQGGEGSCGYVNWVIAKKAALIVILDPIDYPDVEWPQDIETTVVHELLHLHFAKIHIEDDSHEDDELEIGIACIEDALVFLDRRRPLLDGTHADIIPRD